MPCVADSKRLEEDCGGKLTVAWVVAVRVKVTVTVAGVVVTGCPVTCSGISLDTEYL